MLRIVRHGGPWHVNLLHKKMTHDDGDRSTRLYTGSPVLPLCRPWSQVQFIVSSLLVRFAGSLFCVQAVEEWFTVRPASYRVPTGRRITVRAQSVSGTSTSCRDITWTSHSTRHLALNSRLAAPTIMFKFVFYILFDFIFTLGNHNHSAHSDVI